MRGLFSAVASIVMLILSYVVGRLNKGRNERTEEKLQNARTEVEVTKTEASVMHKAADIALETVKENSETMNLAQEVRDKISAAMKSGDETVLWDLYAQMGKRAQEVMKK